MLEIAEFIAPTPTPVWRLARQAGVDLAVGGLPPADLLEGEEPWDLGPLTRMKARYEAAGFKLVVIEARPPLNKAKRGLPGRDEEIETVCRLITNMGALGIPVWCYEWMTDFNWVRTDLARPSRGGSVVTETVFGIPGVGRLLVDAVSRADYPIIQYTILMFAVFFVVINLVTDLLTQWLDPRTREQERPA